MKYLTVTEIYHPLTPVFSKRINVKIKVRLNLISLRNDLKQRKATIT